MSIQIEEFEACKLEALELQPEIDNRKTIPALRRLVQSVNEAVPMGTPVSYSGSRVYIQDTVSGESVMSACTSGETIDVFGGFAGATIMRGAFQVSDDLPLMERREITFTAMRSNGRKKYMMPVDAIEGYLFHEHALAGKPILDVIQTELAKPWTNLSAVSSAFVESNDNDKNLRLALEYLDSSTTPHNLNKEVLTRLYIEVYNNSYTIKQELQPITFALTPEDSFSLIELPDSVDIFGVLNGINNRCLTITQEHRDQTLEFIIPTKRGQLRAF